MASGHNVQIGKKSNAKTQYDIASASMSEKKREQDELTSKLAKIADASELIEREKTLIEKNGQQDMLRWYLH